MNRPRAVALTLSALTLCAAAGPAAAGLIVVNGRFDQPLPAGWTAAGDASVFPDVTDNPFAQFGESTAAEFSGLMQDIVLNPAGGQLAFDYAFTNQGTFSGGPIHDAFRVRLLNPVSGAPLLATPGRDDILYHEAPLVGNPGAPDGGTILFDPTLVTRVPLTGNPFRAIWRHVTIDLSSLGGQPVRLEFGLRRAANGQACVGGIDDVIPEPASAALLLLLLGATAAARLRRGVRQR